MKIITKKKIISNSVLALTLMTTSSFAVTNAQPKNVTHPATTVPNKTATQPLSPTIETTIPKGKIVQYFQNDNLSVQFRYQDGKLVGIKLENAGAEPMKVKVLHTTYILGAKDYVVFNPPNLTSLEIFHGPYQTPVATYEEIFPNRFYKQEVYLISKDVNDNLSTTSGMTPEEKGR